jgi:hypothetical protein
MAKCVFRTDLRQRAVSEAFPCIDASELFQQPAAYTVLERVLSLLAPDEICLGSSDRREIRQGPKLVGFVRIVDACARRSREHS